MQLIEVDFSNNSLKTRKDIASLNLNSNIVVINIENNLVLESFSNSKLGFVFIDEFPKEYTEISTGIYFRNPEKLRKLKSSRYRNIIKQYKVQEKYDSQIASPDWGYSKCYEFSKNKSFIESYDEIDTFSRDDPLENQILHRKKSNDPENFIVPEDSFDEDLRENNKFEKANSEDEVFDKKSIRKKSINLKNSDDEEISAKKNFSIAKLDLKKISAKISNEKSSTKPDNYLEGFLDDLISYCNIEDVHEKEFNLSNDKYEHAISVLKNREDERKRLIKLNKEMLESNENFQIQYNKIFEENKILNEKIQKLEKDLISQEENISKIFEKQVSEKKRNSVHIKKFPSEIEKSRDLEENSVKMNFSYESELSSYRQYSEINTMNSEYSRCIGDNEYLVDSKIGEYIGKLLKKISSLVSKNKNLRETNKKLRRLNS